MGNKKWSCKLVNLPFTVNGMFVQCLKKNSIETYTTQEKDVRKDSFNRTLKTCP